MNIFEEVVLSKAQLSPKLIVDYFDMEWPSTIIFLVITLIALTQNNSYFNHDDDMIPITHVKKIISEIYYFLIIPFQVTCKCK